MPYFFKHSIVFSQFLVVLVSHSMESTVPEQIMKNLIRQPFFYTQFIIVYYNDIKSLEKALAMIPFSITELQQLFYEAVALKKEAAGHLLQTRYNLSIDNATLEAAQESGYQFSDAPIRSLCSGPLRQQSLLYCSEVFLELNRKNPNMYEN